MTISDDHKRALDRARDQIRAQRLVILAGAGVSMPPPSKRPSWPALIDRMAAHAAKFSKARSEAITEQKQTDLLAAVDLYEIGNVIPKHERDQFLREEFQTDLQQVPEICHDLARIGATAWLTTNYDSNLRYALQGRVKEVLSNSDEELRAAISLLGNQRLLIHLHGRAVLPELMVLGSASYERLTTREVYKQLLRDVFLNYSVLAVGFSFSDPPFLKLLRYIDEQLGGAGHRTHYAILPQDTAVDKAFLQRVRFELIQYDSSQGHEYVGECTKYLARPIELLNTTDTVPERSRLDQLVRIFVSLTSKHKHQTFDMAAGAIVANEITERPQRSEVLVKKYRGAMDSQKNSQKNWFLAAYPHSLIAAHSKVQTSRFEWESRAPLPLIRISLTQ